MSQLALQSSARRNSAQLLRRSLLSWNISANSDSDSKFILFHVILLGVYFCHDGSSLTDTIAEFE